MFVCVCVGRVAFTSSFWGSLVPLRHLPVAKADGKSEISEYVIKHSLAWVIDTAYFAYKEHDKADC